MNWNNLVLLTFVCALLMPCNILYAQELCGPEYPDQFPFNSCENGAVMEWNKQNSVTNMDVNSSRLISVVGGVAPYTWSVSGNGFYLDQAGTVKTGLTGDSTITLYSIDACGSGTVTVTDSCDTSVEGAVRSVQGQWIGLDPGSIPLQGKVAQYVGYGSSGSYWYAEAVIGKYKQRDNMYMYQSQVFLGRIDLYPKPGDVACEGFYSCLAGTGISTCDCLLQQNPDAPGSYCMLVPSDMYYSDTGPFCVSGSPPYPRAWIVNAGTLGSFDCLNSDGSSNFGWSQRTYLRWHNYRGTSTAWEWKCME